MPSALCLAMDTSPCDEIGRRYDHHVCIYAEHDGAHECGCGHRWTEPDE